MHRWQTTAAVGSALVLALLLSSCAMGKQAPDFKFTLLDGTEKSLSSYKGEPIVLNFFGKDCVPCMAELPRFQDAYTAKQGQFELIVLASSKEGVQDYVSNSEFTMTFGVDKGGMEKLHVTGIPHTFFIDRLGRISFDQFGEMSGADFDKQLQKIL